MCIFPITVKIRNEINHVWNEFMNYIFLLTAVATCQLCNFLHQKTRKFFHCIHKLVTLISTTIRKKNWEEKILHRSSVKIIKKFSFSLASRSQKQQVIHKQWCVWVLIEIYTYTEPLACWASFSKKLFSFLHSSFIHSTSVGLRGRCGFKECVWSKNKKKIVFW